VPDRRPATIGYFAVVDVRMAVQAFGGSFSLGLRPSRLHQAQRCATGAPTLSDAPSHPVSRTVWIVRFQGLYQIQHTCIPRNVSPALKTCVDIRKMSDRLMIGEIDTSRARD